MDKTIVIAADDPNILYLLKRYAEECGFSAIKTGPVRDAPLMAEQVAPAVILLEYDPAAAVGRWAVRQLHGATATREVPLVIYSHSDDSLRGVQHCAAYLHESVMYDDFLVALAQAGVSL